MIADDHRIVRDGLRALLASEHDIDVVGEVDNGKDAVCAVNKLKPNIILMDLSMPLSNGTEALKKIRQRHTNVKIIVLTVHKAEEFVHSALEAGANAYVLKDDSQAELVQALHSVILGKTYLSPGICERVVNGYLRAYEDNVNNNNPSWEVLTQREREVIKLIAEGYRNKEIAAYLSLSPKTVEKHRSNSMRKLGLHNVSAVTAYALENGLISP